METEKFSKEQIKKMNYLICDRLNGILLDDETPMSFQLCNSQEDEGNYGYLNKYQVDFKEYNEYIQTLTFEEVNIIYKNFWGEEVHSMKKYRQE